MEGRSMADGQIVVSGLTKQYKRVRAVDDLSLTVEPGRVTGFLGPNGADEVLDLVGLTPAANRKFKGYSLGMRQRLGIAAAMLGDPRVLILDEPANGLDPEGIRWMRELLRGLADQGRTILVSSHLLSEMQALADDVVIVAAGRLIRQGPVRDVV